MTSLYMREYNIFMKTQIPYVTQYCIFRAEWRRMGIDIDCATEEQSGLTRNELSLIVSCRNNNIFEEVNMFAIRAAKR